ncbi:hypothetical protein ACHAXR_008415 [Thalassiosira sp. AJA248-18]
MKITVAIVAPLLAQGALAFVQSSPLQTKVSTALNAEKQNMNPAVAAASACLLGLGLSAQAAFANDVSIIEQQQQPQYLSTAISSSTIVAEIEQFALPSYDASKGATLIDLNGEVANVNKKTMSAAKARREYKDESAEKMEADKLRKEEKDGGSLLDSMLGSAEDQRKAAIEAEKAESRANRWKTF